MERITTSIISLFVVLSILNAKANDVPRQNENIIANYINKYRQQDENK